MKSLRKTLRVTSKLAFRASIRISNEQYISKEEAHKLNEQMQTYPHRIRLRGPWICEPIFRYIQTESGHIEQSTDQLPQPRKMTMPCRWSAGGLADFSGLVRFTRRFGYPGRIDANERVWITFDAVSGTVDASLNGQKLGKFDSGSCPQEFAVTELLQPRNELIAEVESSNPDGGLPGEVAMLIRQTAFLVNVSARIENQAGGVFILADGVAKGFCERPLDLYLLAGRSTVAYANVTPTEEGERFQLKSERIDQNDLQMVQVDLIDGGVVWDSVGVPLLFV